MIIMLSRIMNEKGALACQNTRAWVGLCADRRLFWLDFLFTFFPNRRTAMKKVKAQSLAP